MDQLLEFLREYTEFFEKMEQTQVEKLGLLMTKKLEKIEASIMMQQAMDKQLENLENRRRALFSSLGFGNSTLKEIAEGAELSLIHISGIPGIDRTGLSVIPQTGEDHGLKRGDQ